MAYAFFHTPNPKAISLNLSDAEYKNPTHLVFLPPGLAPLMASHTCTMGNEGFSFQFFIMVSTYRLQISGSLQIFSGPIAYQGIAVSVSTSASVLGNASISCKKTATLGQFWI